MKLSSTFRQALLVLGGLLALLTLGACTDAPGPAPTSTPIIIVVTATPERQKEETIPVATRSGNTEPTAHVTIEPSSTHVPIDTATAVSLPTSTPVSLIDYSKSTTFTSSRLGLSVTLPGGDWLLPEPANADVSALVSLSTKNPLLTFYFRPNGSSVREFTDMVDEILAQDPTLRPVYNEYGEETFLGFPAVKIEMYKQRPGDNIRYRQVSYIFKAFGTSYYARAGVDETRWDKGGKEAVDFILSSIVVTPVDASKSVGAFVNDDGVNLREGPSTDYNSLGKFGYARIVDVLGKDASGVWLKVAVAGGPTGWMMAQYVTANSDISSVAVLQAPPTARGKATTTPASSSDVKLVGFNANNNLAIGISALGERTQIGYHDAGYKGKFVLVWVNILNTSGKALHISPLDFRLMNQGGVSVTYDSSTYALETYALSNLTLEYQAIGNGVLSFKVREDFIPAKLIYDSFSDYLEVDIVNP